MPPIYLGSGLAKLCFGAQVVNAVYVGSTLAYSSGAGPVPAETLRYGVSAPATKSSTTSVTTCWIPFLPCHQSGSLASVSVFFKAAGNYKLIVLRQVGETWDEVYKSASRTVAGAGLVSLTSADFGSIAVLPGDLVGIYCATVGMAYETVAGVGCYYITKSGETTATGNVLTPNSTTQQSLQINYTVTGPVQPSNTLFNEGFDGAAIPWRWKHANGVWTYANGKATSGAAGNLNALEYRFEIGHLAQWTWITRFMFETSAARFGVLTRNNSQTTFGSFVEVKQGTGDLVVYAAYSINGSLSALNTYPTGITFAVGTEYEIKVQKSFRTKTIIVSNPAVPAETYSVTINEEDAIATSLPSGNWYGAPSFTPVAGTVSVISTRFDVPTARPDLFFVGDSNTEGSGQNNSSTTVARRVATARGQTLQTSAQGGASTLHTPKRLMGEIAHIAPAWSIISIGTNDTVTADWQTRMDAAYDYLSGICKKAIIAMVPPETADTNPELVMNPYIISKGWPTVRYDLALTTPPTGLAADRNAALFYDTLHCNAAGTAAEAARFDIDQPA